jgi:UDP-N-acetylglucosamine/UDP-N-acetylgalactosamine diphosphorylase
MIKVNSEADKVCVAKVLEAGQGHVFDSWEKLSDDEQSALVSQLREIDFQLLKRLVSQALLSPEALHEERVLRPAPVTLPPTSEAEREEFELCRTLGEYALKSGEVALVMAAGASAACPGGDPLGLLPVGPVTGKSLFQLHAEKIQALNRRYRVSLKWHIFCHPRQIEAVGSFFKKNGYFGLSASDIHFSAEDTLPVVDRRGKILLAGPGRLAAATVGQGGILLQLLTEERLAAFERASTSHLFYFQADNPLTRIADPVFLGHHIKSQAEVSSKTIQRTDPDEELADFCTFNSSVAVVRLCDMPEEERGRRLPDGALAFSAAHTGVHAFSVDFLRHLNRERFHLPFRGVALATPCMDKRGRAIRPSEPNSIRFQSFIFDVLKSARRTIILQVKRSDEFSPIKNTSGANSPQTAQRDLSNLYARWIREAGAGPERLNGEDEAFAAVEISPLYALDAEDLKEKIELPLVAERGELLLGGRST